LIKIEKERAHENYVEEKHRNEILHLRNEMIEKDLDMARGVQARMIPQTYPERFSALYIPMEKVGGDFFDIIPFGETGKTGLLISDVSGHGVQAAMIMVLLKSFVYENMKRDGLREVSIFSDPAKMLEELNDFLIPYLGRNYVTAFYGIYDERDREFEFASAAHPPPILLWESGDGVRLDFIDTKPQGLPLGFARSPESVYRSKRVRLPESGWMVLYSDGLMESIGYDFVEMERGFESFKDTILHEFFITLRRNGTHAAQKYLSDAFHNRVRPVNDDICVLTVSIDR
jgi:serine phosphatase RsbU (regulator of sigma subunit)